MNAFSFIMMQYRVYYSPVPYDLENRLNAMSDQEFAVWLEDQRNQSDFLTVSLVCLLNRFCPQNEAGHWSASDFLSTDGRETSGPIIAATSASRLHDVQRHSVAGSHQPSGTTAGDTGSRESCPSSCTYSVPVRSEHPASFSDITEHAVASALAAPQRRTTKCASVRMADDGLGYVPASAQHVL